MDTSIIVLPCARCGEPVHISNSGSVWKPDGTPYRVTAHGCPQLKTGKE